MRAEQIYSEPTEVAVSERLTRSVNTKDTLTHIQPSADLFRVFEQTIVEYEEEIDRQRRLLDIVWKPEIRLHRTELPQQHVCKEEEVLTEQQLCNQERNSSLDQEEPEPPQIKEEQEEVCSSQEGEQLVLKQESQTFMLSLLLMRKVSTVKQNQTVSSSPLTTLQLRARLGRGSQHVDLQDQLHKCRDKDKRGDCSTSHRNNEHNSPTTETHCNTQTELPQQHVCKEEEVLTEQQLCKLVEEPQSDQEELEPTD
ncbi:zinc finger protein 124-like isoform X1 [Lates japonicus]|uniref:Zinc finger protein 124-like isoform X1 n=1 Tax=Lates japonicus TaxID=270547 RepID=A0AAD3MB50_LATJO|nr:zinc finger protein 124-like isoform X1 [Lates japonicus]